MKRRVLIVAHGHPDFSRGGAEIAAYHLFEEMNRTPGWDAYLLAAHGIAGIVHTGTPFAARAGEREILFAGGTNPFNFSANHLPHVTQDFAGLLERIRPDVVHFHHYAVVGIEMIRMVRQRLPRARIVLTLHEFLAICHNNGQMLKTSGTLCRKASPAECHACIPDKSPQDFFLRELYIKSFFELVDHFVSPSHFLKERYVAWGVDAGRISVIENGQPEAPEAPARPLTQEAEHSRFGYFGQITPYKGLEILLQAFAMLPKALRQRVQLDIHGTGHQMFGETFRSKIEDLLREANRNVRYFGPYAPEDLPRLMARVDWVVVPSIWWENSPLVIQEAFRHRRPVICSDIGGMAEKVQDRETGLHFSAGSPAALAERIEEAVASPDLWASLRGRMVAPSSLAASVAALAPLYLGESRGDAG